jgi:hypothetical protein
MRLEFGALASACAHYGLRMQKTQKKQLALKKEYLRLLNARDLGQARGGFEINGGSSYAFRCDPTQCDCGGGGE